MNNSLFFLLFSLIISHYLFSQETNKIEHRSSISWGVETKLHISYTMSHHKYMRILNERHSPIMQLNIFKIADGSNYWHSLYDYPNYGLSLLASPLSSPKYLGNAYAIVPYINFPMYRRKNFSANFFIGGGIGYITKIFDATDNYKNIAIGSRINIALLGQADFRYSISNEFEMSSGIGITHFSNGRVKTPNLGINIPSIFLGFAWNINSVKEFSEKSLSTPEFKPKWETGISFGGGTKQIYPPGEKNYGAYTLSANIKRVLNLKRKIGAGIDVFYDFSDKQSFAKKGDTIVNNVELLKPGIYLLHDFRLSNLTILFHIGAYLYAKDKNQDVGMFYKRLGIQYYITKNISIQVAMKTHYARIDFIENSIIYSF